MPNNFLNIEYWGSWEAAEAKRAAWRKKNSGPQFHTRIIPANEEVTGIKRVKLTCVQKNDPKKADFKRIGSVGFGSLKDSDVGYVLLMWREGD